MNEDNRPPARVTGVDLSNTTDFTPSAPVSPDPHFRIYLKDGRLSYHNGASEVLMHPDQTARVLRRQFADASLPAPSDIWTPVWLAPGISGCLLNGRLSVMSMMIPVLPMTAGARFFPDPQNPSRVWIIPSPRSGATRLFYWQPAFPVPSFMAFSIRLRTSFVGGVDEMPTIPNALFGSTTIKCYVHLVTDRPSPGVFEYFKLPMPNTFNDGCLCMGDSFSHVIRDQLLAPWTALVDAMELFVAAPWGTDLCPDPETLASCFRWDADTGKQIRATVNPSQCLSAVSVPGISESLSLLQGEWCAGNRAWDHVWHMRDTIKNRLDPFWRGTARPDVMEVPE